MENILKSPKYKQRQDSKLATGSFSVTPKLIYAQDSPITQNKKAETQMALPPEGTYASRIRR